VLLALNTVTQRSVLIAVSNKYSNTKIRLSAVSNKYSNTKISTEFS